MLRFTPAILLASLHRGYQSEVNGMRTEARRHKSMSYCCPHDNGAARLFSRFARRQRRRYEKRGFQPSQFHLIEGLTQAGVNGASLLEIGCGVGYLHQHLLQQGAARATGIDLADQTIAQARELAERRGLADRTDYRVGDFIELVDRLKAADVTILDKVICCYPDARALVEDSLARTRRVYAYTIPRDRWFIRGGAALLALLLWLFGSPFRSYVHDPRRIEAWVTAHGFVPRYRNQTAFWLTQVFVCPESATS